MTCRLYFDEVGNSDLKAAANDPNVRFLSLTGVMTTRSLHDRRIQPALDQLKATYFGHSSRTPVNLHRRDIMQRTGPFAVLADDALRQRFDADLLANIASLPYRVITVTIDKQKHLAQYSRWHFDPYHYCMRCLIERYVRGLEDAQLTGDVMGEARFKKVDKKLKASFLRIYEDGTDHVSAGTIQERLTSKNIKLEPKSSNVAGLQLADLIAHPSFRAMRLTRDKELHPEDFGTKVAEILQADKYRRASHNNQITGYGVKWLP